MATTDSMPTEAEQVFEGIMSLVQSSGQLSGEQLPTREAQLRVWMWATISREAQAAIAATLMISRSLPSKG